MTGHQRSDSRKAQAERQAQDGAGVEDLAEAGYARQFYLLGHPGWPDGLPLNPSTEAHAAAMHETYVAANGLPPHLNPDNYNIRIGVRWEHKGPMPTWSPATATPPKAPDA